MQTSYDNDPPIGFPGMRADSSPTDHISRLNEEASASLPFGTVAKQGTTEAYCKAPSSSTDKLLGLVVSSFSNEKDEDGVYAVLADEMASIARKGRFYALPEQTVAENDPVYVRYTAGGAGETVGRLRKDPDGTAQVDTITPTAANTTQYALSISGKAYFFTSDASGTAAEIVTGLTAAINADADCLATASGSATLVLTAKTAGIGFVTSVGLNLALVNTTASAAKAQRLLGARWASAGTTAIPGVLELNLPA
jgi:hypothetical protein